MKFLKYALIMLLISSNVIYSMQEDMDDADDSSVMTNLVQNDDPVRGEWDTDSDEEFPESLKARQNLQFNSLVRQYRALEDSNVNGQNNGQLQGIFIAIKALYDDTRVNAKKLNMKIGQFIASEQRNSQILQHIAQNPVNLPPAAARQLFQ